MSPSQTPELESLPLPPGLSERYVTHDASEITFHIIEAGLVTAPMILLVHGFPEIAYSWRKIMPSLATAGYYVVAVDQRGYMAGPLAGTQVTLSTSIFTTSTLPTLYGIWLVLMRHPFKGSPHLRLLEKERQMEASNSDIHEDFAQLPEPRKHYKWYYSTAEANPDLSRPGGLREFLRGYYYLKSADWPGNDPYALQSWSATELAKLPFYYSMPLHASMREAIEQQLDDGVARSTKWLPDSELDVYVHEYLRTGFQGGLNWYRVMTDASKQKVLDMVAGKKIETPCIFISGTKDWGIYQEPGVVEKMSNVCTDFRGVKLIEGAGHWVQQEQPEAVLTELLAFLA